MRSVSGRTGEYPIEHREGEIERLKVQDTAWAPATAGLFDAIGVAPGWRCLDLGCGPGFLTLALAGQVGPDGSVTGLDYDAEFVAIANAMAPSNVTFVTADAYDTLLPDGSFDFVHTRFLGCTAGKPERLLAEAVRLTRPGGYVAVQEADFLTLRCSPPHRAWIELVEIFCGCFPPQGDYSIGQQMYGMMQSAGLTDVSYRPYVVGVRAGDPWNDYLPRTVEMMAETVHGRLGVAHERLSGLLADCRFHLAQPTTVFVSPMLVQTWGRVPSAA